MNLNVKKEIKVIQGRGWPAISDHASAHFSQNAKRAETVSALLTPY